MKFKKCSYCKEIKSIDSFYKRSDFKHLYKSQCKICSRKNDWRKKLKGKRKKKYLTKWAKQQKEYRKNNPNYVKKNYGLGRYRYSRAKIQAIRHKCKWLLSKDEYYLLIRQKCCYCNSILEKSGIGLDKINPKKLVYSIKNCVPCCKRCNWIKGSWFTYKQMLKIGKIIKTFK